MVKISSLLKWQAEIVLKDADGNPIIDEKKPVKVWIKVMGDSDLQEAYRQSRIKSSRRRAALRNPESAEYQDEILALENSSDEDIRTLIEAARMSIFQAEAQANVVRPDLPELAEFAVDADAPSLEEQEKFDAAVVETDEAYEKALDEYIKERTVVLKAELDALSREELVAGGKVELSNIGALTEFLNELQDQKVWRGTFQDKEFKVRAFDSIDEFRSSVPVIKDQLREAYSKLELNPDKLKK